MPPRISADNSSEHPSVGRSFKLAEAEAPKKKKGKLPLIVVLVVLLGGGFFMMKGKGKKEEPEIALAKLDAMVALPEEFLVNLAGGQTYLRTKIALLPAATAKKEEIDKATPAIMDAIYGRLRRTELKQINDPDGLQLLKRQLASDINWTLEKLNSHKEEESQSKKKKKKDEHEELGPEEITKIPPADELDHPDWDSEEGPILKIFFQSFATQ